MIRVRNFLSERGSKMWEIVLCPKCGTRLEATLSNLADIISCTRCFEKFTLPYDVRIRLEEKNQEEFALLNFAPEPHLDSSFWLS